jgi:hypothetical protein
MDAPSDKGVQWWIKAIVLFHVFAITFWSIPDPPERLKIWADQPDSPLLKTANAPFGTDWILVKNRQYLKRSFLASYLTCTGFWQYWDMFAPNPASTDLWVDAEIDYSDGSTGIYKYPRVHDLSIPEKYLKERYRKFLERAQTEENQWMWPSFAQRIALEAYEKEGKMPVTVRLRRHWRKIQPPGKKTPEDYNLFVYYTHIVNQDKVKAESHS